MARGRQQKWICLDCNSGFSVQGAAPKICCFCGSDNIGRAPSVELVKTFTEKRAELKEVCERLNPVYAEFRELKRKRDSIMAYWKQQRRRGFITQEDFDALDSLFEGSKGQKDAE